MALLFKGRPIYCSPDGKCWQIQEWHELTDLQTCVCRRVESLCGHLTLTDTAVLDRQDLSIVSGHFSQ